MTEHLCEHYVKYVPYVCVPADEWEGGEVVFSVFFFFPYQAFMSL